jgi:hypothetical protein
VADCLEMLQIDPDDEIQRRIDAEIDAEIERFESMMGVYDKEEIGWFDI